jgi:FtsZ-interacting cell division protein ZipA
MAFVERSEAERHLEFSNDDDNAGNFSVVLVKNPCTFRFSIALMDDHRNELHLILVSIGLVSVILFLFVVIWKLMIRCRKMLNDDPVATRKASPVERRRLSRSFLVDEERSHRAVGRAKYSNRAHPSIRRQTTFSSVSSSSPFLLSDHYRSRSSNQLSHSTIPRTCQYKQQYSLPISLV